MDPNLFIDEIHQKLPALRKMLIEKISPLVKCYFYINLENFYSDGHIVTLIIYSPDILVSELAENIIVNIYSDARYSGQKMPPNILQIFNNWIDSISVVKDRQIQRTGLIKEELVKRTWYPGFTLEF